MKIFLFIILLINNSFMNLKKINKIKSNSVDEKILEKLFIEIEEFIKIELNKIKKNKNDLNNLRKVSKIRSENNKKILKSETNGIIPSKDDENYNICENLSNDKLKRICHFKGQLNSYYLRYTQILNEKKIAEKSNNIKCDKLLKDMTELEKNNCIEPLKKIKDLYKRLIGEFGMFKLGLNKIK